ncbi:hypothetical protein ANN_17353 [Periplaneta americana]|uniref:G-protein coupled receptors family 1 profile domain-containing protein n=1 Tax=Periplaneta americana TaxID=6978 RepID=A0ABQ8SSP8_PERAM|nr:hypothetical protein ANN_17353 [Periplaneta americana]
MSLSPTDSAKLIALIEDGNSQRYVAAVLGIPRSTVQRVYLALVRQEMDIESKVKNVLRLAKFESMTRVRREFRHVFNEESPHDNNIRRWNRQLKETGSILGKKRTGRPLTNDETVEDIRRAFVQSPKKSLRPGCQVAGFLTVFASELSIYTLAVITSERWYAITYALHLNKRLRLSTAGKVMAAGWIYAVTMATLPLLGISGYSKTSYGSICGEHEIQDGRSVTLLVYDFSICLPMENRDLGDQVYLVTLLLVNGLAFVLICACYGRIYCAIRGHNSAAAHSDTTVAKRMALLVFTDFACWAPIAFFGLTAVAGYPLIDVPHTKILLVFFYPLNSCANPYLYALLTKQYRRDLFTLLSRYGLCTKKAARYKGADIGYSSGNSVPQNCKGTSTGGSGVGCQTACTPANTDEMNHAPQGSRVAPIPSIVKPRSSSADGPLSTREHRGSPHPLRNSNTRLNLTCEQEMILRRVLDHPDPTPIFLHPSADSHL